MKKLILLLLVFAAVQGMGQIKGGWYSYRDSLMLVSEPERQLDTVDVLMMVSDTTEQFYIDTKFTHGEIFDGLYVDYFEKDTVWTGTKNHEIYWRFGKEVLELHNTSEGNIDAGACLGCWEDYWVHKEYLDELGYKLPKGLVIWQSVPKK